MQNSATSEQPVPRPSPAVATRLRQAVRAAGGNQRVADRSGVPLATVNNYVRGRNGMKIEALAALAASCNVSLQWLVSGDTVSGGSAEPGFAPVVPGPPPGLGDTQTAATPSTPGTPSVIDVPTLAKAIEIVQAIAGDTASAEPPVLARQIASAYALLMQPPTA